MSDKATKATRKTMAIDADLHKQIKMFAILEDLTIHEATEKIVRAGIAAVAQQPAAR